MTPGLPVCAGPLAVRVKEPSPGLFFWVITRLAAQEHMADLCVDTSDHPYPTHEAAMNVGAACLKAHRAVADQSAVLHS